MKLTTILLFLIFSLYLSAQNPLDSIETTNLKMYIQSGNIDMARPLGINKRCLNWKSTDRDISLADRSFSVFATEEQDTLYLSYKSEVDTLTGIIEDANISFDRIWKINGKDIKKLIEDFESDQSIEGDIPLDILAYPANGNPQYGNELNGIDYIPYHDHNNDGKYNVYDGDYPIVNWGENTIIPQEMTIVFNHDAPLNRSSATKFIGLSIASIFYTLPSDGFQYLDNAIFSKKIFRNMHRSYEELYLGTGQWISISNQYSDAIGSDIETNTLFAYNQNQVDINHQDMSLSDSISTAMGYTVLSEKLYSISCFFSPNFGPTLPEPMYDPRARRQFLHMAKGLWLDATPMTIGGNGYDTTSDNTTNYIYHGDVTNTEDWNYLNAIDYKGQLYAYATVKMENINESDYFEIDAVYHALRDPNEDHIGVVPRLLGQAESLNELYHADAEFLNENGLNSTKSIDKTIHLYPNPVTDFLHFSNDHKVYEFNILDIHGNVITHGHHSQFNCKHLSNGTYILQLRKEDRFEAFKFMVRH